jgi:hypothetical protein
LKPILRPVISSSDVWGFDEFEHLPRGAYSPTWNPVPVKRSELFLTLDFRRLHNAWTRSSAAISSSMTLVNQLGLKQRYPKSRP